MATNSKPRLARSKCYARCHMTLQQYALYQYASDVSYKSGKFYASGPKVAIEFAGTTKNTIYRVVRELVGSGWLQVLVPRYRDPKTGMFHPMVVKPVTHDEWKKGHPDAVCPVALSMTEMRHGSMTDSGYGSMTETGNGTMTDFEPSMTDLRTVHDRNREQVLEVRTEGRTEREKHEGERSLSVEPATEMKDKDPGLTSPSSKNNTQEQVTILAVDDFLYDLATYAAQKTGMSIGCFTFYEPQKKAIAVLAQGYTFDEIGNAWIEHLRTYNWEDIGDLKYATRQFCSGAGETILRSQGEALEKSILAGVAGFLDRCIDGSRLTDTLVAESMKIAVAAVLAEDPGFRELVQARPNVFTAAAEAIVTGQEAVMRPI